MRRRKIIVGVTLLILFGALALFGVWSANRPVLVWKVSSIRPVGSYLPSGGVMEPHWEPHCWGAQVVVSNLTSSEVVVDWNRDETAFQIDGHWESLGISALMPYLGPNEARTVPLIFPQRAEACRFLMHYEHGPFMSKADQFLKRHRIYVPDKLFTLAMRLTGHYKRLLIEVKVPAATRKLYDSNGP